VIKERLGSRVDSVVHTLFPFLFRRPINPDLLTVVGTIVSLAAAVAFARGEIVTGGLLMWLGGFFDLVDGVVARHFGTSTTFGGFLDSTLDRVADMMILLGIIVHFAGSGDSLNATLASIALVSSVVTSYSKARAELHIDHMPGGIFERGERCGLLIAGSVLGFLVPVLWILAVGTTLTAGQRLRIAYREMTLIDAAGAAPSSGEAAR
jgi:CDP-diacylglycerol--glycerol-3-phosphate 3-phosphatidyltransferase